MSDFFRMPEADACIVAKLPPSPGRRWISTPPLDKQGRENHKISTQKERLLSLSTEHWLTARDWMELSGSSRWAIRSFIEADEKRKKRFLRERKNGRTSEYQLTQAGAAFAGGGE